jgi:hypothetical protein
MTRPDAQRAVQPGDKAWTQGDYNSASVSVELCAFARWTAADWDQHPTMLETCAAWIREEANRFDIPVQRLSASQAQGSGRGVCGHRDLGAAGGGHSDPGTAFPWDRVLDMARGGGAQPPPDVLGRLITATTGDDVPEYLLADSSHSDGAGQKYAAYASGLAQGKPD